MARPKQIAADLGVSPAQVTRWRKRGMPLEIEAARAWHAGNIRPRRRRNGEAPPVLVAAIEPAAPATDPPTRTWRDRADRAAAKLRELELKEREGRLLDVARARKEFGDCWFDFVALLKAFPSRTAPELMHKIDEGDIHRVLDSAIYELRMDLYRAFVVRARAGLMDEAAKALQPGPK